MNISISGISSLHICHPYLDLILLHSGVSRGTCRASVRHWVNVSISGISSLRISHPYLDLTLLNYRIRRGCLVDFV